MSWTNAAVTETGLALQAKLVDGQTLGFLRVAAGTGTVDPSVLANQTALVNEKQTLTFQPPNVLDGAKIKVPVMLNNIGLETGYTMQQLGFFADDPDDGEILYAIVQDEVGDTVPSQTESPGFVIEWAFVFQYGNAGSVTVTLDPVGLVSIGMVGQPGGVAGLDENGAVPIAQGGTGATTEQGVIDAFGIFLAISAAAAYDPEGSYAVGDYCTHGGNLHKCNTAIPSGEPWNAAHWTETTVAAELAGKANAMPAEEIPLPLVSGVNKWYCATIYKTQEDIVVINAWLKFDVPLTPNVETVVSILPESCRPSELISTAAFADNGSNLSGTVARVNINPDGNVVALCAESLIFFAFTIAYRAGGNATV